MPMGAAVRLLQDAAVRNGLDGLGNLFHRQGQGKADIALAAGAEARTGRADNTGLVDERHTERHTVGESGVPTLRLNRWRPSASNATFLSLSAAKISGPNRSRRCENSIPKTSLYSVAFIHLRTIKCINILIIRCADNACKGDIKEV